jgi:diguanylate cyclase (GGDEF)-like protein/PAS domain S-box-containing protein
MAAPRPASPKPPRDAAAPVDAISRARLFASVVANAKDAVIVTEAEPVDRAAGGPRIVYVNEAFTTATGYTWADAVGQTPRMLQSPRTDQRELDRLRLALRRWSSVEVELLNVRKDGTEFWVQFILVPVAGDDGWYTHWVSIQRDVTVRRRGDEELTAMVQGTTDVVALVDPDGTIRAASPAAERTLPLGHALVGCCCIDLLRPAQRAAGRKALTAVGNVGTASLPEEIELETRTGWRWFEVTPRLASVGEEGAGVVLTAIDVTDRRRERAALLKAQQRFLGAFADAPIGMAVHSRDGSLLEVNDQLCRLLGRDEATLLGLGLDDLVHPDDHHGNEAERLEVFAGTLAVGRRETRLLHADGRVVGVMISSSVVRRDGEVTELVVHIEDISERKALEARLTHQALHDGLTQLPNRALFLDRLETALRRGERDRAPVSVLFLDLDRFKAVNDTLGHETGDQVLTTVAGRLSTLVRPGDTAARFGGDEFTFLCESSTAEQAALVADRIADAIEAPIALDGHGEVHLTASIGIAIADRAATTAEMLLRDADMAMYAAKKGAGVRYEIFDERLRSRTAERLNHEQELSAAITSSELELSYQPLFGVDADGPPLEFEALVRWRHPRRGLLFPASFIALAEDSDLILALDRWVLQRACQDAARVGAPGGRFWVNVSSKTLSEPRLADQVAACLEEAGLDASALGLEITERAVVEGGEATRATVGRLRTLGVELAADDFGTGYSSLSALIERPVDVLKIDRSFVSELPAEASMAVVRAIVAMAAGLGLRTVAEGVEREEQLEAVRALGCDRVQGFLLARPMPIEALLERYSAQDRGAKVGA